MGFGFTFHLCFLPSTPLALMLEAGHARHGQVLQPTGALNGSIPKKEPSVSISERSNGTVISFSETDENGGNLVISDQ